MSQFDDILTSIVVPPPLPKSPVPTVTIALASSPAAMFEYFNDKKHFDLSAGFVFTSKNLGILSLTHSVLSKNKFQIDMEVVSPSPKFYDTIFRQKKKSFVVSYGIGEPSLLWAGPFLADLLDSNLRVDPGGREILSFSFVPDALPFMEDVTQKVTKNEDVNEDSGREGFEGATPNMDPNTPATTTEPKPSTEESVVDEPPREDGYFYSEATSDPEALVFEEENTFVDPVEDDTADDEVVIPLFDEAGSDAVWWWRKFVYLKNAGGWVETVTSENSKVRTLQAYLDALYQVKLNNKTSIGVNLIWNNPELVSINEIASSDSIVKRISGNDSNFNSLNSFLDDAGLELRTKEDIQEGFRVVEYYIDMPVEIEKKGYQHWFDRLSTAISKYKNDTFQYEVKWEGNLHLINGWYVEQGVIDSDIADSPILFVGSPEWMAYIEGRDEYAEDSDG